MNVAILPESLRSSTAMPRVEETTPAKVETKVDRLRAAAKRADEGDTIPTSHMSRDELKAFLRGE